MRCDLHRAGFVDHCYARNCMQVSIANKVEEIQHLYQNNTLIVIFFCSVSLDCRIILQPLSRFNQNKPLENKDFNQPRQNYLHNQWPVPSKYYKRVHLVVKKINVAQHAILTLMILL